MGKIMTRQQIITDLENKLQNHHLSLSSRLRDEAILKYLKEDEGLTERYRALQGYVVRLKERGLEKGRKFCWRDGKAVIENCYICDKCIQPGDLAWNEGEEVTE